jgi:hypothetical protein
VNGAQTPRSRRPPVWLAMTTTQPATRSNLSGERENPINDASAR